MRLPLRIHQNVRRLQIPVQDPVLMSMVNGPRHRDHEFGGRSQVLLESCYMVNQVFSLDEPHREVLPSFVFANFVNGKNVGMIEAGDGFGLEAKPSRFLLRRQGAGKNHLEGDQAI